MESKLYKKLNYIINEGMIDTVLSFVCPIPVPEPFTNSKFRYKKEQATPKPCALEISNPQRVSDDTPLNRSIDVISDHVKHLNKLVPRSGDKKEPEVIIHVCDEVKNAKKDFQCPQKLLVTKMGYFAEISSGQKLDEMDISVHCDIQIFDWLMKWMKLTDFVETSGGRQSICEKSENLPNLDSRNVISILVSAGFLQMEPLIMNCLSFCHARLCEVVRCSSNLSCLNDCIITRLADMFTNLELEMVRDKKERLTPRLWMKLIQNLCEPEPEALRGHLYSLAGLFRCSKCGAYLTNTIESYITCQPPNNRLTRWGQLRSSHARDSLWNINNFISHVFEDQRKWRRVYWKLWAHCHFLFCSICETYFPVSEMRRCRFHPLSASYLEPYAENFIAGTIGQYPCCGQKAFRFGSSPETNGCHFRGHSVLVENNRERRILQIMQVVNDGCLLGEPSAENLIAPHTRSSLAHLPLNAQQCVSGLLSGMKEREINSKTFFKCEEEMLFIDESCSESSDSEPIKNFKKLTRKSCDRRVDYSSDGCESEQLDERALCTYKLRKKQGRYLERYWCADLSARSNQDHQREYEENAIKNVYIQVENNEEVDHSLLLNRPIGGLYVKLELEWRDQLKQKCTSLNTNTISITGSGKFKQK